MSTIPATFKGLDVVFQSDSVYTHGSGDAPIFNCPRGMIVGLASPDKLVTSTSEQEALLRKTLAEIIAYRTQLGHRSACPTWDDPAVAYVFNGMTPEQAAHQVRADYRQTWMGFRAKWLADQEKLVGQHVWASGANEFARIGVLVGFACGEEGGSTHQVKLLESDEVVTVYNTDRNFFLPPEVVAWAQEVAQVALTMPAPTELPEGYSSYYGVPTNMVFPPMPEYRPWGNNSVDYLRSVNVVYGDTPQIQIKTRYMGLILGGNVGSGVTYDTIKLSPDRRRSPEVGWRVAEQEVRFDWNDGAKVREQTSRYVLSAVGYSAIFSDGLFLYEDRWDWPFAVPPQGVAVKAIAEELVTYLNESTRLQVDAYLARVRSGK